MPRFCLHVGAPHGHELSTWFVDGRCDGGDSLLAEVFIVRVYLNSFISPSGVLLPLFYSSIHRHSWKFYQEKKIEREVELSPYGWKLW